MDHPLVGIVMGSMSDLPVMKRAAKTLTDLGVPHEVKVLSAHRLPARRAEAYVHRVAEGSVVQPYRAVVDLGRLTGDRTIVAIGQTRHLGGGLLIPYDVPATTTDEPDP